MFYGSEFTFAGESSLMYGLRIYSTVNSNSQSDVSFGNKASITETRINNRIQPIHFGVNYHDDPLSFNLIFGSLKALSRFDLEEISLWLTGYQDYQWLSIGQADLSHVQFRCLITDLTPITIGNLPYAFQATVTCDCPYAYSYPFEYTYEINGETSILFTNKSTTREYLKPDLYYVSGSGTTSLSIVNADDDNREFLIEDIPTISYVSVDNTNGIIKDEKLGYNLYGGFNFNFFRLVQGDNNLTVTGTGTLTISGRFLHNVAA